MGEPQATFPWKTTYYGPAHFDGYDGQPFTIQERKSFQFHERVHRNQCTWDLLFNKSWTEVDAYQKQITDLKQQYKTPPASGSPQQFFLEGQYLEMQFNEGRWANTLARHQTVVDGLAYYGRHGASGGYIP